MDIDKQNRTYHEAQDNMEFLPQYYAWTYGVVLPFIKGKVIELGCGSGLGIPHYIKQVEQILAIDHNSQCLEKISNTLPYPKVMPIKEDLIGDWENLKGQSADTILIMDALEHFKDDQNFLLKARSHLSGNGKIIIKVPAGPQLYSSIDRASGHYRRYDKKLIKSLSKATNMKIEKMFNLNAIGRLAYRFKNKENKNFSKTFSPSKLKLINLSIPLIRLFDYTGLPGLSIICILSVND